MFQFNVDYPLLNILWYYYGGEKWLLSLLIKHEWGAFLFLQGDFFSSKMGIARSSSSTNTIKPILWHKVLISRYPHF